ncbi:MAG: hypothetical protein WCI18_01695 [Pseudomonadota bacterium]
MKSESFRATIHLRDFSYYMFQALSRLGKKTGEVRHLLQSSYQNPHVFEGNICPNTNNLTSNTQRP